jgi:transcriptional regulator with XRE-family HTH domain
MKAVPSDSSAYGLLISDNIVAARARARLSQASLAARMKSLGYGWYSQTVGSAERGERRVTAEEVLGLALALETSVAALLRPSDDDKQVVLPAGQVFSTRWIRRLVGRGVNDGGLTWNGDVPVFADPARAPEYQVAVYDIVPASQLAYDDGSPVEGDNPYASKWPSDDLGKQGEDG